MKHNIKPSTKRRGGGVSSSGTINSIVSFSTLSLVLTSTILLTQQHGGVGVGVASAAVLSEKEVLHHIFSNLNGKNWDTTWDITSDDICNTNDYAGVTCDANDHVTEIDLSDNNLAGSISPHIYTLPYLKRMDFSKNRITSAGWDRIDVVLEDDELISQMEVIDVTNNLINTVEGVTKMSDTLTGLHMTYNNLKGSMPEELFQLEQLEILAISENELTGKIDTKLGQLTNLREFYCYGNKLTGEIPSEVGLLTKMKIFTVSSIVLTYCYL